MPQDIDSPARLAGGGCGLAKVTGGGGGGAATGAAVAWTMGWGAGAGAAYTCHAEIAFVSSGQNGHNPGE